MKEPGEMRRSPEIDWPIAQIGEFGVDIYFPVSK
jgi:hypothetical protein